MAFWPRRAYPEFATRSGETPTHRDVGVHLKHSPECLERFRENAVWLFELFKHILAASLETLHETDMHISAHFLHSAQQDALRVTICNVGEKVTGRCISKMLGLAPSGIKRVVFLNLGNNDASALANDRSRETSGTEGGVLHLNIECGEIEKDDPQAYATADEAPVSAIRVQIAGPTRNGFVRLRVTKRRFFRRHAIKKGTLRPLFS